MSLHTAIRPVCMPLLQIHQAMIADEEYKALKSEHLRRAELITEHQAMDRSACLLARGDPCDGLPEDEAILGTLDLYAVKAVQGEVLIGKRDALRASLHSLRQAWSPWFCPQVVCAPEPAYHVVPSTLYNMSVASGTSNMRHFLWVMDQLCT